MESWQEKSLGKPTTRRHTPDEKEQAVRLVRQFRKELDRPTEVIVQFIDNQRNEFGVEPVCAVLQVAPSTYSAAKSRPVSARPGSRPGAR